MARQELKLNARMLGELRLGDFCPRCHWIKLRCEQKLPFQIPLPGIFSSLDSHVKHVVHAFLDSTGRLPGWFPDIGPVKRYLPAPHWSKFAALHARTRTRLRGMVDDFFELDDGSLLIVDYKTARFTDNQDELMPLYEVQLNSYAYIAEALGMGPIAGLHLIYCEPDTLSLSADQLTSGSADALGLTFTMTHHVVEDKHDEMLPPLLRRNREIWDLPEAPPGRPGCRDCERLERLFHVCGVQPEEETDE